MHRRGAVAQNRPMQIENQQSATALGERVGGLSPEAVAAIGETVEDKGRR